MSSSAAYADHLRNAGLEITLNCPTPNTITPKKQHYIDVYFCSTLCLSAWVGLGSGEGCACIVDAEAVTNKNVDRALGR